MVTKTKILDNSICNNYWYLSIVRQRANSLLRVKFQKFSKQLQYNRHSNVNSELVLLFVDKLFRNYFRYFTAMKFIMLLLLQANSLKNLNLKNKNFTVLIKLRAQ